MPAARLRVPIAIAYACAALSPFGLAIAALVAFTDKSMVIVYISPRAHLFDEMLNAFKKVKKVTAGEVSGPRVEELKRLMLGRDFEARQDLGHFIFVTAYHSGVSPTEQEVVRVAPGEVVSNPWSRDRLESVRSVPDGEFLGLFEGFDMPQLNGFTLRNGSRIYFVSQDGNHRVADALERGVEYIPCRVSMYPCLPQRTYLLEPFHRKLLKGGLEQPYNIVEDELKLERRTVAEIIVALGAGEVRYL